jgi:hypothetical protein
MTLDLIALTILAATAWMVPFSEKYDVPHEPWDEILSTHTVYLDKKGEHKATMHIVDKICSLHGQCNNWGLAAKNEMWIVDGKFGNMVGAMHFNDHHGCTTYLHERYHLMYGDWKHEIMPWGCDNWEELW